MRLLYFYTEFHDDQGNARALRKLDHIELNLSCEHYFHYDNITNTLYRSPRKRPLPKKFWENERLKNKTDLDFQSNIRNLNVLAGANGSGKSTIIQYVIDLLDNTYSYVTNCTKQETDRHNPWTNRNLLLFEDIGNERSGLEWFLLDYVPNQINKYPEFQKNGFSDDCPKSFRFFFRDPKDLNESCGDEIRNSKNDYSYAKDRIIRLLKRTKIVYMTNTLTKRDYLLNLDSKSYDRRRDKFIYDCSLGAKIGSNISSFFAYEIYRQVKYVFDRKQRMIRERLKKEIPEIPCPHALRIRPRVFEIRNMFKEHIPNCISSYIDYSNKEDTLSSDSLADLLSALCVASYILNISMRLDIPPDYICNRLNNQHLEDVHLPKQWENVMEFICEAFIDIVRARYMSGTPKVSTEFTFERDYFRILKGCCLDYLDFLYENSSTFLSRFQSMPGDKSFLLSLESIDGDEKLFSILIEFIQKYRYTCEPVYTIEFDWGLSSGEESLLRLFSDLYYVFDRDYNIESNGDYTIYNNVSHIVGKEEACNTVLLFMDEADLTLHPEWQRRLIHILTAGIPSIYPMPNIEDIQIILSTHSPLLLGDVPEENIIYMLTDNLIHGSKKSYTFTAPGETFGQNIHVILKDSFFLSKGTVGEFAADKINAAARQLYEISTQQSNIKVQISLEEMDTLRKTVSLVAPGILRNQLDQLLHNAEQFLYDKDSQMVERIIQASSNLSLEDRKRVIELLRQQGDGHD